MRKMFRRNQPDPEERSSADAELEMTSPHVNPSSCSIRDMPSGKLSKRP